MTEKQTVTRRGFLETTGVAAGAAVGRRHASPTRPSAR